MFLAQRRVRFTLTENYGTAPIAVPRLANYPTELTPHVLYEALLIRDEFAIILSLKTTINLWFSTYAPRRQSVHTILLCITCTTGYTAPISNTKFDRCSTVGRYLSIGLMLGGSRE